MCLTPIPDFDGLETFLVYENVKNICSYQQHVLKQLGQRCVIAPFFLDTLGQGLFWPTLWFMMCHVFTWGQVRIIVVPVAPSWLCKLSIPYELILNPHTITDAGF